MKVDLSGSGGGDRIDLEPLIKAIIDASNVNAMRLGAINTTLFVTINDTLASIEKNIKTLADFTIRSEKSKNVENLKKFYAEAQSSKGVGFNELAVRLFIIFCSLALANMLYSFSDWLCWKQTKFGLNSNDERFTSSAFAQSAKADDNLDEKKRKRRATKPNPAVAENDGPATKARRASQPEPSQKESESDDESSTGSESDSKTPTTTAASRAGGRRRA